MRPRLVPAALAAALCSPLCAQLDASEPARRLLDSLVVPLHQETLPDGHVLGIWAAGPDWKASFHDGLCVLPRPTHPDRVAKPWRWRTLSVRAGARELPLARSPEPDLTEGMRAEYPLGPVVERYELRAAGLEQSVLFSERIDRDWTNQGSIVSQPRPAPPQPQHAPPAFPGPDRGRPRHGAKPRGERDRRIRLLAGGERVAEPVAPGGRPGERDAGGRERAVQAVSGGGVEARRLDEGLERRAGVRSALWPRRSWAHWATQRNPDF